MRRKGIYVCAFFVFIFSFISIVGCQSGEKDTKKEKVRLEFYNRKREMYEVFEEIIQLFNESQDEIEVYQNMNTNSDTALRISSVEGNFPDIVQLGGLQSVETSEYVMGGFLRPLENMKCINQIKEEYLPYLTYDSHIYQMPLAMSFEGIYINKDLFEEENLKIPDSYEELCEVSEVIMQKGGIPFIFADKESWTVHQNWESIEGAYRGNFQEFWTSVAQGETSFVEDDISRGALEKLIELHRYTTEEYSNLNYDEAMTKFAAGEGFMFMQGSWAYRSIIDRNSHINVEMIPFPVDNNSQQKLTMWVDSSVGISKDCEYPAEAEKFIEFLMRPEILQIYIDEECSFSCMKNTIDRADYAPRVKELILNGQSQMDATWLPLQTSIIRDKDILTLMPDAGEEEIEEYLEKYTRSLRKHSNLYLEAKDKTCHFKEK